MGEGYFKDLHFINGEGKEETLTGYLGKKKHKSAKTITLTSDIPFQCRQQGSDAIPFGKNPVTYLGRVRNIESGKDSFSLLFDEEMFDLLLQETKICIESNLEIRCAPMEHLF